MLTLQTQTGIRLCDGISRRDCMHVGGLSALGLTLPALLQQRQAQAQATGGIGAAFGKAKSVILLMLLGGPPQHESWDPKPDAPAEIRGEFSPISTAVPGIQVGELMPLTARLVDRIGILRGVASGDNAHSSSGYQMLTGQPHLPLNVENARPGFPNDWPVLGGILKQLRQHRRGMPVSVTIPEGIANTGNFPWPGQDGGFLGRPFDPWLITCDPSSPDYKIPDLTLPDDMTERRFEGRRDLLRQIDDRLAELDRTPAVSQYQIQTAAALDMLHAAGSRKAFDIAQERDETRNRYGRHRFGQSVLLARRLVEAGVSLVQVNWTTLKGEENFGSWDTHAKNGACCKKFLMPMMDAAFSALIEDLEQRGLLDETLVCWLGEFGRTPRINGNAGRDHWGPVFSLAFAGAGIRGGTVYGSSDKIGGYPASGKVAPCDVTATIFHALGYRPETEMRDTTGRPLAISRGQVIEPLF